MLGDFEIGVLQLKPLNSTLRWGMLLTPGRMLRVMATLDWVVVIVVIVVAIVGMFLLEFSQRKR